ncbi:hypothetical protein I7I48_08175 [Histoplasma ohiense]|nr:hypothetical protein I7I48_08175 [Histoplasma ohiense (nom. inval.)]
METVVVLIPFRVDTLEEEKDVKKDMKVLRAMSSEGSVMEKSTEEGSTEEGLEELTEESMKEIVETSVMKAAEYRGYEPHDMKM